MCLSLWSCLSNASAVGRMCMQYQGIVDVDVNNKNGYMKYNTVKWKTFCKMLTRKSLIAEACRSLSPMYFESVHLSRIFAWLIGVTLVVFSEHIQSHFILKSGLLLSPKALLKTTSCNFVVSPTINVRLSGSLRPYRNPWNLLGMVPSWHGGLPTGTVPALIAPFPCHHHALFF